VSTQPSLRERKRIETRRRTMEAGLRLFAEHGFEETTVEAIADAANIAPRTFFRYFPAKVDLLFADHEDQVALLRGILGERATGETVARAVRRAALTGVERTVIEDPKLYLTRSGLESAIPAARARGRQLDADFEDAIATAIADERGVDPAGDLPARLEARVLWSATRAARQVWLANEGRQDPRELLNEAFDLVERGLG
jgi:AcrR family transcriptional regulator